MFTFKFFKPIKKTILNMKLSQLKSTIKYVIYFTVEVNWEVLENLNERLLFEWDFADGRLPDLLWKNKYVRKMEYSHWIIN